MTTASALQFLEPISADLAERGVDLPRVQATNPHVAAAVTRAVRMAGETADTTILDCLRRLIIRVAESADSPDAADAVPEHLVRLALCYLDDWSGAHWLCLNFLSNPKAWIQAARDRGHTFPVAEIHRQPIWRLVRLLLPETTKPAGMLETIKLDLEQAGLVFVDDGQYVPGESEWLYSRTTPTGSAVASLVFPEWVVPARSGGVVVAR